jgi:hypothetical protein
MIFPKRKWKNLGMFKILFSEISGYSDDVSRKIEKSNKLIKLDRSNFLKKVAKIG